jgi:hypothetical protein
MCLARVYSEMLYLHYNVTKRVVPIRLREISQLVEKEWICVVQWEHTYFANACSLQVFTPHCPFSSLTSHTNLLLQS